VLHLLQHTSGIYDFTSKLYFELTPRSLFDLVLGWDKTKYVSFAMCINEINKNTPRFPPLDNPWLFEKCNYCNTGYDILGAIIHKVSGITAVDFINNNIFRQLNMNASGFHIDEHPNESIPYETDTEKGIKEQQNFYCGNACISCTLRDYNIFLSEYNKLLSKNMCTLYSELYFFSKSDKGEMMFHMGAGDFSHKHARGECEHIALTNSMMIRLLDKDINIIISENYKGISKSLLQGRDLFDVVVANLL
jgi:hypothetical protein